MKIPTGRPAKHPVEFMMAVAQRVVTGELTYRQAMKRYGVSHGSIGNWVKKYQAGTLADMKQPKERLPKKPHTREAALENEIKALKQELANLYMINQMLKKAQIFADRARKDASSLIISGSSDPSSVDVD
jgi:transposase-like protein